MAEGAQVFRWAGRLVVALALLPVLGMTVAASWAYVHTRHYMQALSATTTGQVIALIGTDSVATRFAYTDQKGARHEATTAWNQSPAPYAVGDPVKVFYDPTGRESPTIDSWFGNYILPFILGIFAGVSILGWLFLLVVYFVVAWILRKNAGRAGP